MVEVQQRNSQDRFVTVLRCTSRRKFTIALFLFGLGVFFELNSLSYGQTPLTGWPQRNVRFVLPFGPASGTDVAARLLGDRLAGRWGKAVVIDNRPGGDNLIAINAFLSANDDHVLLFASSAAFLAHPYVHEKLSYNFARDIAPIARISDTVLVAAVPASSDITSIAQFVERARAAPENFNLSGATGLPEFAIDAFLKSRQLKSARIPYRDLVGAARDLGEGRIQFLLTSFAVVRPFVEAGKIRILAAGSRERTPMLKDIPSVPETGFTELAVETSLGFYGPKDMSLDVRSRIAGDIIDVVDDPKIAAQILSSGQEPRPGGPEALSFALKRQAENTAAIARILGMEPKK